MLSRTTLQLDITVNSYEEDYLLKSWLLTRMYLLAVFMICKKLLGGLGVVDSKMIFSFTKSSLILIPTGATE
ncbi:Hypothetical predicted protein [Octopus vulgaris]|uniref:Uncharacterized protein n=1 Tax=Octopus vulgaris TaxID=6645 RepID=A0AA36BL56_OCTVU|nr:Hypothetical predicted protein [Octopus vulgaris]